MRGARRGSQARESSGRVAYGVWVVLTLGLASSAACAPEEPTPPPGERSSDVVWLRGARTQALVPQGAGGPTGPSLVYLNRCESGCALRPAAVNDSRRNESTIVPRPVNFDPFLGGDDTWDATLQCLRRRFASFDVLVTDEDPGQVPHLENVVSGSPLMLGLANDIAGVSPGACDPIPNAISFTFAERIGGDYAERVEALCLVAAHELGHSFGLEHQYLCSDVMTYLDPCGKHSFVRADAPCGEQGRRPCECRSPELQNTFLHLLTALGPGDARDQPPEVSIESPVHAATVEPDYPVLILARDDRGLARIELRADDVVVGTSTSSPASFFVPGSPTRLEARAIDSAGQTTRFRRTITVRPRAVRPDAEVLDAVYAPPPAIIGLRPDAGPPDAGEAPPATSGCRCARAPRDPSGIGLALGLGVLLARRRKRASRWGVAALGLALGAALALLAGCDDTTLTGANGRLSFEPAPGTTLDLGTRTIGRDGAARTSVRITNVGDVPVELDRPELVGADAALVEVIDSPRYLEPGRAADLVLTLGAGWAAPVAVELQLSTSASNARQVSWPVAGTVRAPCQLSANPVVQRLDLDAPASITVSAAGLSACTIDRVTLDEAIFELVDPPTLPFTVPAGQSRALGVRAISRGVLGDRPRRTMYIFESEGSVVSVSLQGPTTAFSCLDLAPTDLVLTEPIARGDTIRVPLTLMNHCVDESVDLLGFIVGRGHQDVRARPLREGAILRPGERVQLEAFVEPTAAGPVFAELILRSSDAARQPWMIASITARAQAPEVFAPPSVDLEGALVSASGAVCNSRTAEVPLANLGPGRLFLTGVTFQGRDADRLRARAIRVDGDLFAPGARVMIPEGHVAFVQVEAVPDRVGPIEATLALRHTGRVEVSRVALRSAGLADAPRDERFPWPASPPLDLLFIPDGSRSMALAQPRLDAATSRLAGRLAPLSLHATSVVPLADGPEAGIPFTSPPVWRTERELPDRLALWLSYALRGGTPERPPLAAFTAALRFMSAVFEVRNPFDERPLEGALRPDARLAIVVVTNEDDQSVVSPEDFVRVAASVRPRPRPRDVIVSALVADPDACELPYSIRAQRVGVAVGLSGGVSADLCAPDLGPALDAILDDALRPESSFALAGAPEPGTVTVTVDGSPVPPGGDGGFKVEASVVTLGSAVTPGREVRVRYQAQCQPR